MNFLSYSKNKNRLKNSNNEDFIKHIKDLLEYFDNPQYKIKNIIHVAGTNGKGSTINFIANILKKSGYSYNLFTSPHLIRINERFCINGEDVDNKKLKEVDDFVKKIAEENNLDISYFEACVIIALLLFKDNISDFNLFEVGLGGRYDATNIFDEKLLSVVTSISLDHVDILGSSIEEIALNKIAIANENSVLFTSKQKPGVLSIFDLFREQLNCKLFKENFDWSYQKVDENSFNYKDYQVEIENITPSLKGEHQFENASLAIASCLYLKSIGFKKIDLNSIKKGIENTKWRGRFEILELNYDNLDIIVDGCHNEDGILKLQKYLENTKENYEQNIAIFTMIETKNIKDCINILEKFNNFDEIYIPNLDIEIYSHSSFKAELIRNYFNEKENIKIINDFTKENIDKIFKKYKEGNKKTRIIFFGSLYFIGKVLEFYEK